MVDIRTTFQALMAPHYSIERELGRGGMGTVHLARDLRHDRPVALKVMHPGLGVAMGAARFRREVKLAARLQHPHIVPVHDSGETNGQLWYTMPFIEGESLRGRLVRERRLPLADAVRVARDVASALDYAHRRGVVHRDVKPENVLIDEQGHALLADFGLARALGGTTGAPVTHGTALTDSGFCVGTASYMSPEQASGERETDGRTDVYALGCVVYEMLAGDPPFSGKTEAEVIARRLVAPAPLLVAVPPALAAAVAKALALAPADRFASAGDFADALARGAEGAGGTPPSAATRATPRAADATLFGTPAWLTTPPGRPTRPEPRRRAPSVAVLVVAGVVAALAVLAALLALFLR